DTLGNLGPWQVQNFSLGTPRTLAASATIGRYLYVIGGNNGGGAVSTAERAMILDPSETPTLSIADLVPAGTGLPGGYWPYRGSAMSTPADPDNPGGQSLASAPAIVELPTLAGQKTQVVLSWTAPVDTLGAPLPNVAGYLIYRIAAAGDAPGSEVLL